MLALSLVSVAYCYPQHQHAAQVSPRSTSSALSGGGEGRGLSYVLPTSGWFFSGGKGEGKKGAGGYRKIIQLVGAADCGAVNNLPFYSSNTKKGRTARHPLAVGLPTPQANCHASSSVV